MMVERWRHDGYFHRWDQRALALNLSVAMGIALAVSGCYEVRCRSKLPLLQTSLFEILILTTVLAAILGWMVRIRNIHQRSRALETTGVRTIVYPSSREAPVWLSRLVGRDRCIWFDRRRLGSGLDI